MTELLTEVQAHLRITGVAPSRFGREAVGDPRFVFDLRAGRKAHCKVRSRVLAYLANPNPEATMGRVSVWPEARCWELLEYLRQGHTKQQAADRFGTSYQAIRARIFTLLDQHLPDRPAGQRLAVCLEQIFARRGAIFLPSLD